MTETTEQKPHLSDWCWYGQHTNCLSPYCHCECGCDQRNTPRKDTTQCQ